MNLDNIITSQHFLDDEIVSEKLAAADFTITVSPEFAYDGGTYRILIDGHHSLAASLIAGVSPEITEADAQSCDTVGLLENGDVELFIEAMHMREDDYIFAVSRKDVW